MALLPVFNFAADLHLREHAWKSRPEISGDAYTSLQQIVADCKRRHLPLVLGGDLLQRRRPDPAPVAWLARAAEELDSLGLSLCFIQGNHDWDASHPWPMVAKHAAWLHRREIVLPEELPWLIRVVGLDWTPRDQLGLALEGLRPQLRTDIPPERTILVCHQAWQEIQGGSAEGSLSQTPYARLVLTGDFHECCYRTITGADGQLVDVYSPGSICMQATNEPPDKYFLTVCVDEETGLLTCQRQQLYTRAYEGVAVYDESALDTLCDPDWIQGLLDPQRLWLSQFASQSLFAWQRISQPILRVTYHDHLPRAYERIVAAAAAARVHLFLNPVHVSQASQVAFPQEDPGEETGSFETLADAVQRLPASPEAQQLALRLLNAAGQGADLDEELQRAWQEWEEGHAASR